MIVTDTCSNYKLALRNRSLQLRQATRTILLNSNVSPTPKMQRSWANKRTSKGPQVEDNTTLRDKRTGTFTHTRSYRVQDRFLHLNGQWAYEPQVVALLHNGTPTSRALPTGLDESTKSLSICLTSDGRIRPVSHQESPGVFESLFQSGDGGGHSAASAPLPDRPTVKEVLAAGHQLLDLRVPGTNLEEQLTLLGGGKKLLLRAFSEDTPAAEPIVRRCNGWGEVLEHVLGVLKTGAESVNLVLGYEMLQLKYDKMDVVNEAEHRKKLWIITHYAWGPVRYFRLWPEPDTLQPYLDSMVDPRNARKVQESILRQLRRANALPQEVERFIESTGGEGSDKVFPVEVWSPRAKAYITPSVLGGRDATSDLDILDRQQPSFTESVETAMRKF
ncbi:unnamed protein product [Symbiodinium natans]|uniref:Uncharacterized protein n=1 Tax=Symbiodinium natans TaxID=878477 RepID=A0A812GA67_9DINO|nr:unnamed protein product [Symbiodinium natans]